MFVASYRNTMAGAKPKFRPDPAAIQMQEDLDRMRRHLARLEAMERERGRVLADIDAANQALARVNGGRGVISMAKIVRRICRALKVSRDELISDRRNNEVVLARQAICYWTCRLTRLSLPEIGRKLDRDHTSILHGRDAYPVKRKKMGRYLRPAR